MSETHRTGQAIFDIAIHLMDAQNESTGSTETADTKEYKLRTPNILNNLMDRVYSSSDTYPQYTPGQPRPVCRKISDLSETLDLDERICTSVLPYGLAALLLTEEDPTRANFFWQVFWENLNEAKNGIPASAESIEDVYGVGAGLEYGQFAYWA